MFRRFVWVAFAVSSVSISLFGCSPANRNENSGVENRYAQLDKLPDFGGNWAARNTQRLTRPDDPNENLDAPLSAASSTEVEHELALSAAGKPPARRASCRPHGGADFWGGIGGKEIVMSPGQMFIWSGQGNDNLRRIYIDGRKHSENPDPSYMGESVATWDNQTLVVDTIAFRDWVAAYRRGDAALANDGDMHMVERFHLTDKDTMQVDIEITAPKIFTKPWTFTRILERRPNQDKQYKDEYVCEESGIYIVNDADGIQKLNTTPPADILDELKKQGIKVN